MIRINLLPHELRCGNRVSAKVLVAAFASVLAVSAAAGWFGLVWYGSLVESDRTLAAVEVQLLGKQQRAAYYDKLQKNRRDYAQRVQTIQDIGKSRRLWSKFLDEMIDVVNNNGDTERHLAWFDGMVVRTDHKGATIRLPGQVQEADKTRLANFHDDIEAAPFADSMIAKSDPSFRLVPTPDRMPSLSLKFPLKIELFPSGETKKGGK
jgi:Tfp pilus assembly protein PilN